MKMITLYLISKGECGGYYLKSSAIESEPELDQTPAVYCAQYGEQHQLPQNSENVFHIEKLFAVHICRVKTLYCIKGTVGPGSVHV